MEQMVSYQQNYSQNYWLSLTRPLTLSHSLSHTLILSLHPFLYSCVLASPPLRQQIIRFLALAFYNVLTFMLRLISLLWATPFASHSLSLTLSLSQCPQPSFSISLLNSLSPPILSPPCLQLTLNNRVCRGFSLGGPENKNKKCLKDCSLSSNGNP